MSEQGKKRQRGNGKFSSKLDSPESERDRKRVEKRERESDLQVCMTAGKFGKGGSTDRRLCIPITMEKDKGYIVLVQGLLLI